MVEDRIWSEFRLIMFGSLVAEVRLLLAILCMAPGCLLIGDLSTILGSLSAFLPGSTIRRAPVTGLVADGVK